MKPDEPLLRVRELHAHYGKSHVLRGVSLDLRAKEVVALIGRNGSGRSTTLKAIMGLLPPSSGAVELQGKSVAGSRPYEISRAGIAYVPEERDVFANLTVDENLRMGEQPGTGQSYAWTFDQMFAYFPRLKERRNTLAGSLSGGEQQMLTICRSLLGNPKIMLIDEPTEGLAPKIVAAVADCIRDIHQKGVSVILVEQKLAIALKVSTRVLVMGQGRIVYEGTPRDVADNDQLLADWLAV
ncbi:ABC transporter ATP-binding protein [Pollutimonas bauzanensis]|uniref:Amino acid/amide ABC transporter ATP-binding protein 2, HAAT family (TC 3.A.1.4.-) n=1 Tax=Pollutimonas bauzanensis TaxID=658167 RepID=A0A1M5SFG7_9BURK|nr:ABC transporter ATP-binding protein [Pollutimonas bauzanensis]SHH37231.1 amino acid/amide ABC transporter ATP-binding protein 2, HAAT family (TC 3.A.1.4.-) [Pollutimonas bauzanensis]